MGSGGSLPGKALSRLREEVEEHGGSAPTPRTHRDCKAYGATTILPDPSVGDPACAVLIHHEEVVNLEWDRFSLVTTACTALGFSSTAWNGVASMKRSLAVT